MEEKTQEKIDKLKKEVNDLVDIDAINDLVKNNCIEFNFGDVSYKVRKPTFKEKQELNEKRISKYTNLLKDDNALLEEDLKKLYKKRGIDIYSMDENLKSLDTKRKDYMLKLGKAIKENDQESDLEKYKDEIKKINIEINEITLEKTVLLDSSIETRLNVYVFTYLSFLVTDKLIIGKDLGEGNKEADKWERAWETYDDFLKESEELVNIVVWNATLINKSEVSVN